MCEPTTIALTSLAVAGATTASGIVAQNEQYSDAMSNRSQAAKYGSERYQQAVTETTRDVAQQIDTLRIQRDQVRAATYNQIRSVADDARKAMGVTRARNAERGVKGRAADILVDEFERDFMNFEEMKLMELNERYNQYNLEEQAVRNRGQSIINSGYPQPLPSIRSGSPIVPILQGATAGLGVAGSLTSIANSDALKGLGTMGQTPSGGLSLPKTNVFSNNPFGGVTF
jgi:hypothetical protein